MDQSWEFYLEIVGEIQGIVNAYNVCYAEKVTKRSSAVLLLCLVTFSE